MAVTTRQENRVNPGKRVCSSSCLVGAYKKITIVTRFSRETEFVFAVLDGVIRIIWVARSIVSIAV